VSAAPPLRLDTAACDKCGRCAPSCPAKALRIGPGYILVDWELCTGCGRCAEVCDSGAIRLRGAAANEGARVVPIESAHVKKTKGAKATGARTKGAGAGSAKTGAAASSGVARKAGRAAPISGPVTWTLPEAALVLVVAFALLVGIQALPGGLAGAPVWAGVTLLVYDVALGALLWFLARRNGATMFAAFRLDVRPEAGNALLGLVVAFGCWLFSIAYRAAALFFGITPPASAGVDLARTFGPGALGLVLTVLVVALAGPLLEEVLLRGVVLGAVARKLGPWPAIVGCALAFALLHASLWSLLPLTVLGVGLGWLAVRSRSLWPAVIAHVLYNAVLVAAAFYSVAR
jgi:membrane protease YdiL (CAAX protease family)/NAD-dependent dihydropyrimidine dehydrogenase PreA subunit